MGSQMKHRKSSGMLEIECTTTPVRCDRPSSDGAVGITGITAPVASNPTRISSDAENSSLKILKCLWA